MTYAMAINVFFVLVEIFTVFYAAIPEHTAHFEYLYLLGGEPQPCSLDVGFWQYSRLQR